MMFMSLGRVRSGSTFRPATISRRGAWRRWRSSASPTPSSSGEMIRVGLLIEQLTGRKRRALEVGALAVATAFTLYFTWYAVR